MIVFSCFVRVGYCIFTIWGQRYAQCIPMWWYPFKGGRWLDQILWDTRGMKKTSCEYSTPRSANLTSQKPYKSACELILLPWNQAKQVVRLRSRLVVSPTKFQENWWIFHPPAISISYKGNKGLTQNAMMKNYTMEDERLEPTASPMKRKENDLNQTSMIVCNMLHPTGVCFFDVRRRRSQDWRKLEPCGIPMKWRLSIAFAWWMGFSFFDLKALL